MRRGHGVTVKEIAAFLNVTPARVRQIVTENSIESTGSDHKAKLYDARQVISKASSRDRASRLN